jgi:hypothetical protein
MNRLASTGETAEPYAQCRVMRGAGRSVLVRAAVGARDGQGAVRDRRGRFVGTHPSGLVAPAGLAVARMMATAAATARRSRRARRLSLLFMIFLSARWLTGASAPFRGVGRRGHQFSARCVPASGHEPGVTARYPTHRHHPGCTTPRRTNRGDPGAGRPLRTPELARALALGLRRTGPAGVRDRRAQPVPGWSRSRPWNSRLVSRREMSPPVSSATCSSIASDEPYTGTSAGSSSRSAFIS